MDSYNQNQHQQRPQQGPGGVSLAWNGTQSFLGLSFKILLLNIITLGIYRFWGTTEVRRRIWASINLQNQPLEYTGTGLELFLGFLKVVFLFLMPAILILVGIQLYMGITAYFIALGIFYLLIFYFIGVAQYSARNYRLSRTNWRGIRGSMAGSAWAYGLTSLWSTALVLVTLGWATPWVSNMLQKRLTDETRFGDTRMNYDGTPNALYAPFVLSWLSTFGLWLGVAAYVFFLRPDIIATLQMTPEQVQLDPAAQAAFAEMFQLYFVILFVAIVGGVVGSLWYNVRFMNHTAASTTIDRARFHLSVTVGGLLGLIITNWLILMVSLGIAIPVIQARSVRFIVDRLKINGSIDFQKIAQSQARLSKTGEGLAQAFDVDGF